MSDNKSEVSPDAYRSCPDVEIEVVPAGDLTPAEREFNACLRAYAWRMVTRHVRKIGDSHVRADHERPTVGCPWCIPDDVALAADAAIRGLNDREWVNLSAHTARFALAAAALTPGGAAPTRGTPPRV